MKQILLKREDYREDVDVNRQFVVKHLMEVAQAISRCQKGNDGCSHFPLESRERAVGKIAEPAKKNASLG